MKIGIEICKPDEKCFFPFFNVPVKFIPFLSLQRLISNENFCTRKWCQTTKAWALFIEVSVRMLPNFPIFAHSDNCSMKPVKNIDGTVTCTWFFYRQPLLENLQLYPHRSQKRQTFQKDTGKILLSANGGSFSLSFTLFYYHDRLLNSIAPIVRQFDYRNFWSSHPG